MLTNSHLFDHIAVRFAENPPIKVGTELIKAVTRIIIRRPDSQKMPANGHHLHRVLDCSREIENVLKSPTVEDAGKSVFQAIGDWLIDVVDDRRLFIVGKIKGVYFPRTQQFQDRFDESGLVRSRYRRRNVCQGGSALHEFFL